MLAFRLRCYHMQSAPADEARRGDKVVGERTTLQLVISDPKWFGRFRVGDVYTFAALTKLGDCIERSCCWPAPSEAQASVSYECESRG